MKNLLIISIVLLGGVRVAFGEGCGFERDTDLDGKFASSTSSDKCSSSYSVRDSLLDQSYHSSQIAGGQGQLFHLVELCRASVLPNHPATMAKKVALTLFRVATSEPGIKLRAVGQKNAAACLSYVEPETAMELLSEVNFHHPVPGEWLYEDPRYNAAEIIFINFARRNPLDLSSITAKAQYLGQTGQYPYVGVARVIHGLPASLKKAADMLLSDALAFYANETGFYNRDEEFLRLLQLLKDSVVDKELAAQALATFVRRLKNDPIHLPGDYYAEIQIDSNGKIFSFTDRNEAFLFQAFPTIRRFNPRLAAQLRQRDAKLEHAADHMNYISGGLVQGNPTFEQATRQHLEWLQDSLAARIQQIKECPDCNQEVAVHLAQRLTDLNSRVAEASATVPGITYTPSKPPNAHEVYVKHTLTSPTSP